jgi:hypothetical protein
MLNKFIKILCKRYLEDDYAKIRNKKTIRSAKSYNNLINAQAIFLITPGRSGTKTLINYCQARTKLYCVHSPQPWLATIGYLAYKKNITPEAIKYSFYTAREKYLKRVYERGIWFLDGDCKNLPIIEEIGELMPNSLFLHVVRSPDMFIKSGLNRGYYSTKEPELWGHLESNLAQDKKCSDIHKIAYLWNSANIIAENAKKKFGERRVQTIIAEDMFSDPTVVDNALIKMGLTHEINKGVLPTIKILNAQIKKVNISNDMNDHIRKVVDSVCTTYKLYYK